MARWTDTLVDLCPARKTVREKPWGYNLVAPNRTQLHNEASGLRSALRAGPPLAEDLGEAVTAWGEVRNLATKEHISVPTGIVTTDLLNGAAKGPADWADKVDVACTDIMRQCVAKERKSKDASISIKINQGLAEHILSMEDGGRSSGFLRRAAFNGST